MKKSIARLAWMMAFAFPVLTFSACSDDKGEEPGPELSTEAEIVSVTFANQDVIKVQPALDKETTPASFVFYVRHDVEDSAISALIPTITISEKATISPESDKEADFTKGSVRYTVTAEDGKTTADYDLVCKKLPSDAAYVMTVTIDDNGAEIVTEQPSFEPGDTEASFKVRAGTTVEEKNSLKPVITFEGASMTPESGEAQTGFGTEGYVMYKVTAENGTYSFDFKLTCITEAFTGATIDEIYFDSDLIVTQPDLSQGVNLTFIISGEASAEQIAALSPTIKLSDGATFKYDGKDDTGVFVEGVTRKLTVTSEDTKTSNEYLITGYYKSIYYSLDNWYTITEQGLTYPMENQWWNANPGVVTAITMGAPIPFPLNSTTDTPSGTGYAAELKTLKTDAGTWTLYPNIVAGNLYLGGFKLTNILKPIESTKFGIPFYEKPVKVVGMFKYLPGDPQDWYNNKKHAPGTNDSFAMTALLYEVDEYGDFEDGKYDSEGSFGTTLTGDHMAKIETNASVVALKQWFSTDAYPDFTRFELELEYLQDYDPEKKYKFSMIFSSSKDGASYKGCVNSTLILDDIYVVLK